MTWFGVPDSGVVVNPGVNVGDILVWNGSSWVANSSAPTTGDILVWNGTTWVATASGILVPGSTTNSAEALLANADGAYEPAGIRNNAGKVDFWQNYGKLGAQFDLYQETAANRPTYQAIGNRTGGPAAQFVRATPTQLHSAKAELNAVSYYIVLNLTASALNQRLLNSHVGGERDLYVFNNIFRYAQAGAELGVNLAGAGWLAISGTARNDGSDAIARRGSSVTTGSVNPIGAATVYGLVMGDYGLAGGAALEGTVERAYFWNTHILSNAELTNLNVFFGLDT